MSKKALYAVLTGLGASLLAVALWSAGALSVWERGAWDLRVRLLAQPSRVTPQIKLVLLDEPSIEWAQNELALPWPWPREVYAPILEFLARGGARVVAFDVLFLAFSDAAYRAGSLYHAVTAVQSSWIALSLLMVSVLLLGLLRRERHGVGNIGFESFVVLILYLGSVVLLVAGAPPA